METSKKAIVDRTMAPGKCQRCEETERIEWRGHSLAIRFGLLLVLPGIGFVYTGAMGWGVAVEQRETFVALSGFLAAFGLLVVLICCALYPRSRYHFLVSDDGHKEYHAHTMNPVSSSNLLSRGVWHDATWVIEMSLLTRRCEMLRPAFQRNWKFRVTDEENISVIDADDNSVSLPPKLVLEFVSCGACEYFDATVVRYMDLYAVAAARECAEAQVQHLLTTLQAVVFMTGIDKRFSVIGRSAAGSVVREFAASRLLAAGVPLTEIVTVDEAAKELAAATLANWREKTLAPTG